MSTPEGRPATRRRAGALALSGALAAGLLTLGVTGTLSSWTSAILGNDDNEADSAGAVVLEEAGPGGATCTTASSATNTATCSTINKYGGTATPLMPGGSRTVDVTFTNLGAANGTTFALAPGTCSQSPAAGSGTPTATNLCTSASELTVALGCSPGASYAAGSAWSDLAYAASVAPTATKTHTATGAELNAGAQWTCRFTVALNAAAAVASQNITVSQPLTWTLGS